MLTFVWGVFKQFIIVYHQQIITIKQNIFKIYWYKTRLVSKEAEETHQQK